MVALEHSFIRAQFPVLKQSVNQLPLIYLDNAATSQKPQSVIDAECQYYQQYNANVHRASHSLSVKATNAFEQSRALVQQWLNAPSSEQIIWTKGATEAINLVANSWGLLHLKPDDEILLSYAEHHANIVPWQLVAQRTGAQIKVLPLTEQGVIATDILDHYITQRTKIVCCAHVSNVIGKLNPIEIIIAKAKSVGALTLIDGAQAVAHFSVDVQALGCDFYLFSAHKMYGPTGLGVLYGRHDLLTAMPPYQAGGEMIETVSFAGSTYNQLPFKFEAGTPNIAGVIAFAEAIRFLQQHLLRNLQPMEQFLVDYTYQRLNKISGLKFIVSGKPDIGIFAFTLAHQHSFDVATMLDSKGIAIRSGHHCAMPLMAYLQLDGCIRVSLAPFNTKQEIDFLYHSLTSLTKRTQDAALAPQTPACRVKVPIISEPSDNLIERIGQKSSWDSKHREIMLLGKVLSKMPQELRSPENLIQGCESSAWLSVTVTVDNKLQFQADADAKIIRGLLVIILAAYQQKTAIDILAFDIEQYFSQLGLLQHLSPSRGNGLRAIVKRIQAIATQRL